MDDLDVILERARGHEHATIVVEGKAADVTSALARVARVLDEGSPLVIVPNRRYRSSFLACASADGRVPLGTGGPPVITAAELCTEVLRACGADVPRVMLPFEEDLVIEDLKVSGLKPRRVQEMARFFVRGFSELSNRDPGWLVSGEERELFELLRDALASRGAVYASQLGGLALAAFEGRQDDCAFAGRIVIVDGYTALDHATQALVDALRPALLVAGGRNGDCGVPQFPYFDSDGLSALRARGAVDLPVSSSSATRASVVRAASPESEAEQAARIVRGWLDDGIAPERVLVEVPDRARGAELERVLARAGVPLAPSRVTRLGKATSPSAPHGAIGAFATLGLAADPHDAGVWRTWLALGEWLGNSAGWSVLRAIEKRTGRSLGEALEAFSTGGLDRALEDGETSVIAGLSAPVARGWEVAGALQGLEGRELSDGIAHATSPEAADALRIVPGESASQAYARVRRELFDPEPSQGAGVRLVLQNEAAGLSAARVCHTGTLEGVLPEPDVCDPMTPPVRRERLLRENRRAFGAAVQHGAEQVVFTWPQEMGVEQASRAKIHIERIYVEDGRRVARLARSRFLDELFQTSAEERS